MEMLQALRSGLAQMDIPLDESGCGLMCEYGRLLLEKNQVMNLTAITQPEAVARQHFCDCLAITKYVPLRGKSLVDVGCGAGFPGLPLKIATPDLELTLLDSLGKRVDWLDQTCRELGLDVTCVNGRAEDMSVLPEYREGFDIATARAVARLNILAELCLPFVKVGGCFAAMKGSDSEDEIAEAKAAIKLLGGKIEAVEDYELPGAETPHRLVIVRKLSPTPRQYPRRYAKIKKEPLA